MTSSGTLNVDPDSLAAADGFRREIRLIIPYVGTRVTRHVLRKLPALMSGLDARVLLIAVHTAPFPRDFECPTATHGFLVDQLIALSRDCPLPADTQVVLARTHEDGYRFALDPCSLVVVGSRKRFWRTDEERLARALAADGHKVALVHVEDGDD